MAGVAGKTVKAGTGTLKIPGYMMDHLEKTEEETQIKAFWSDGECEAEVNGNVSAAIVLVTALLAHVALNVADANPEADPNRFADAVAVSAKQIIKGTREEGL